MSLLDAWSQRALQRRDGKVEFLGEQSGTIEDTLKRDLILEFATRPDIRRAYLATVSFGAETKPASALCISSDRGDDRSLTVRVGEMFRRRFGNEAQLDVLFLSTEEEARVAGVCRPFYARPGA